MRTSRLTHEFVRYIPERLSPGVLYISTEYATAMHLCCCGCGSKVVTPLSPADWQLTFDGESISLHPSIGNWSYPCQSHYWIRRNAVRWAAHWKPEQIAAARGSLSQPAAEDTSLLHRLLHRVRRLFSR
ncbi:hypothetical protein J7E91_35070 [Streptomyces sp. ISL-99]|uniref:DUF6527 family protein n=1 Tax=Streptomyces sp. ISL-99 TaxID=2819193 RepID=UPI001BE7A99C|nr:DUF6527 family protein [Streptomyces sp. ISL-99]MBT2530427.1 hypothetical protein [Streptomyces sp. ISL-99]